MLRKIRDVFLQLRAVVLRHAPELSRLHTFREKKNNNQVMLNPLPVRQLIQKSGGASNCKDCVSIMTFNILAQCYTRSEVP